jgi:hypothetical protein
MSASRLIADPKYPQAIGVTSVMNHVSVFGNSPWEILHNEHADSPFFTSDYPVAIETFDLNRINFSVAPDVIVPTSVAILRLPPEAESVAPELQGYSYIAVEELVAIVDTSSRKITNVMQRMRRQENNKSGQ